MAKKKQRKSQMYATLIVRSKYEHGLKEYWVWELLLFRSQKACMSLSRLTGTGRFGTREEAIKKAESDAKLLNIEIDRRSLLG